MIAQSGIIYDSTWSQVEQKKDDSEQRVNIRLMQHAEYKSSDGQNFEKNFVNGVN